MKLLRKRQRRVRLTEFSLWELIFAAVQFSKNVTEVFSFRNFAKTQDLRSLLENVEHLKSVTNTYSAIKYVAEKLFTKEQGSREGATRVLMLITDGKSTDITPKDQAISATKSNDVITYAIGIGNDFNDLTNQNDLKSLVSQPVDQHFLKVSNYDKLSGILKDLQSKIFAIEGSESKEDSISFQMELSQGGFSALLTPDTMLFGAVGAYDWAGGVQVGGGQTYSFLNVTSSEDMKDAYLGYSVKSATYNKITHYIVGAPRHQHIGAVFVFSEKSSSRNNWTVKQSIKGSQIGSYFGAELCTVDLNRDGETDLLLIGAPMYHGHQHGGLVHACVLENSGNFSCTSTLKGVPGNLFARFGAAIASISDINGDTYIDVAIGSPLEDNQQGAVYIFLGQNKGIKSKYSQRIEGQKVSSGIKFFGQSIDGTFDLSQDGLTDITIGALGEVVMLRSRPVLNVSTTIRFHPELISLKNLDCDSQSEHANFGSNLTLCLQVRNVTAGNLMGQTVTVNYWLNLDWTRAKSRAVFSQSGRSLTNHSTIHLPEGVQCSQYTINLHSCMEDYASPIKISLNFSMNENSTTDDGSSKPILDQLINTTLHTEIPFERYCGDDNKCVANLRITSSYSGPKAILLSGSPKLIMMVTLENTGEDAYHTKLRFSHPAGLSFRKIQIVQANKRTYVSRTDIGDLFLCFNISHPVFRNSTQAEFKVLFDVSTDHPWNKSLKINISAVSDNEDENEQDNSDEHTIPLLYAFDVIVKMLTSVLYVNFTKAEEEKEVFHTYQVENSGRRHIPFNITLTVPLQLDPEFEWRNPRISFSESRRVQCFEENMDPASNPGKEAGKTHTSNCMAQKCRVFHCRVQALPPDKSVSFTIRGAAVFKQVPQQAIQKKLQLELKSFAVLSCDLEKYNKTMTEVFYNKMITTEVEVIQEFNFLPYIIGASVGGIFLLVIITVVLYKVGFFKRNYKDMLEDKASLQNGGPGQEGDKQVTCETPLNTEEPAAE
nr:PREDICTED: integrin alpha-X-like [Latimeria chalumnae]|eukprot:XP_006000947.2 PREDICTED: integrin alpha-X-like [Latimeria chalumnae]